MGPDWTLLPPELIQFISEKIPFKVEYYLFRAVCPAWRHATFPHPRHLTPPLPWLLLPQKERSSVHSFYDFSDSKVRQFNLPYDKDTYGFVVGSSRSWFVLKRGSQLSLMNVITGQIKSGLFPSLDTPPVILGFAFNEKTKRPSTLEATRGIGPKYQICKISMTSSPHPYEQNCTIVASFYTNNSKWELAFCSVHDRCWTVLRLPESGRGSRHMMDFMYQNGRVYAIDDLCQIFIYDLGDLSKKIMPAKLLAYSKPDSLYLVTGENEHDGPLIVRRHNDTRLCEEARKIEVYKCYEYGQNYYRCKRVKDIGNNVLLLDNHRCIIFPCDGKQPHGWARNHIYYYETVGSESYSYSITLNMLNINNRNISKVEYGPTGLLFTIYMNHPTWFTHSLN